MNTEITKTESKHIFDTTINTKFIFDALKQNSDTMNTEFKEFCIRFQNASTIGSFTADEFNKLLCSEIQISKDDEQCMTIEAPMSSSREQFAKYLAQWFIYSNLILFFDCNRIQVQLRTDASGITGEVKTEIVATYFDDGNVEQLDEVTGERINEKLKSNLSTLYSEFEDFIDKCRQRYDNLQLIPGSADEGSDVPFIVDEFLKFNQTIFDLHELASGYWLLNDKLFRYFE